MPTRLEVSAPGCESLLLDLFGTEPDRGDELALTDGVRMRFLGRESASRGHLESSDLIMFALSFPAGIATSMIADVIGDHLRKKSKHRIFTRAVVVFEEVETVDAGGGRTTKRTTRREEIDLRLD